GDSGIGSSTILDPDGRPLKNPPSKIIGGVYAGDLINRDIGVLMNPYTATQFAAWQLFVSEPFNNTIAVVNLVQFGTDPSNVVFGPGPVTRIASSSLKLPVDLAPVQRDRDSITWASNTTLDEDSDFYVANRGDNTIVRMRQDGTVVGIRRVTINSLPLENFTINGIATSVDSTKIYVTFTTPTPVQGGLLEVPAYGD